MGYWAGLFVEDEKKQLEESLNAVLSFAMELAEKNKKTRLTLRNASDDEQE